MRIHFQKILFKFHFENDRQSPLTLVAKRVVTRKKLQWRSRKHNAQITPHITHLKTITKVKYHNSTHGNSVNIRKPPGKVVIFQEFRFLSRFRHLFIVTPKLKHISRITAPCWTIYVNWNSRTREKDNGRLQAIRVFVRTSLCIACASFVHCWNSNMARWVSPFILSSSFFFLDYDFKNLIPFLFMNPTCLHSVKKNIMSWC